MYSRAPALVASKYPNRASAGGTAHAATCSAVQPTPRSSGSADIPHLPHQPPLIHTWGLDWSRERMKVSTTRLMCHRVQAMELLWALGSRAKVASSSPSRAESTMVQLRSRELRMASVAPIIRLLSMPGLPMGFGPRGGPIPAVQLG